VFDVARRRAELRPNVASTVSVAIAATRTAWRLRRRAGHDRDSDGDGDAKDLKASGWRPHRDRHIFIGG